MTKRHGLCALRRFLAVQDKDIPMHRAILQNDPSFGSRSNTYSVMFGHSESLNVGWMDKTEENLLSRRTSARPSSCPGVRRVQACESDFVFEQFFSGLYLNNWNRRRIGIHKKPFLGRNEESHFLFSAKIRSLRPVLKEWLGL